MTIKEFEKLSGMKRANIRFYEREGLITPKRMDNGYRDYSEDDLQILLRVKLLRSLHISLESFIYCEIAKDDACFASSILVRHKRCRWKAKINPLKYGDLFHTVPMDYPFS